MWVARDDGPVARVVGGRGLEAQLERLVVHADALDAGVLLDGDAVLVPVVVDIGGRVVE